MVMFEKLYNKILPTVINKNARTYIKRLELSLKIKIPIFFFKEPNERLKYFAAKTVFVKHAKQKRSWMSLCTRIQFIFYHKQKYTMIHFAECENKKFGTQNKLRSIYFFLS